MNIRRRERCKQVARLIASACMVAASLAPAQQYPTKPIRVLTAELGGGSDFTARLILPRLTEMLGQQIVVENRTGGVILGELAARAQPDGYTLMLYSGSLWHMPYMRDNVPYHIGDFAPISHLSTSPLILVVHPTLPAKSVAELIALAKSRPGELNYASGPLGAAPHLAGELFKYLAGVDIVHIPFKGVGLAVNDVIAGRVQLMFSSMGGTIQQVRAGRLRALAITSARPSALLPDMPTVASAGLPGFEAATNNGLFAPARTPAAIVERLNRDIEQVIARAELRDKFLSVGLELVGGPPARFSQMIKMDAERTGKLIKAAGIRAE